MLKEIFKISFTIILIGLISFGLNTLLQEILIFFNTYLDGMYQFIQQFSGLANCEYLIILTIFLILTIIIGVVSK